VIVRLTLCCPLHVLYQDTPDVSDNQGFPARRYIGRSESVLAVVAELEGDAEIVAAEHGNRVLELVFG
jgi:hypothetical protein